MSTSADGCGNAIVPTGRATDGEAPAQQGPASPAGLREETPDPGSDLEDEEEQEQLPPTGAWAACDDASPKWQGAEALKPSKRQHQQFDSSVASGPTGVTTAPPASTTAAPVGAYCAVLRL